MITKEQLARMKLSDKVTVELTLNAVNFDSFKTPDGVLYLIPYMHDNNQFGLCPDGVTLVKHTPKPPEIAVGLEFNSSTTTYKVIGTHENSVWCKVIDRRISSPHNLNYITSYDLGQVQKWIADVHQR